MSENAIKAEAVRVLSQKEALQVFKKVHDEDNCQNTLFIGLNLYLLFSFTFYILSGQKGDTGDDKEREEVSPKSELKQAEAEDQQSVSDSQKWESFTNPGPRRHTEGVSVHLMSSYTMWPLPLNH